MNKTIVFLIAGLMAVTATAQVEVVDEVIVSAEETGRDWNAELSTRHEVWNKPACSAYTMSEDRESSLEIVAFYNAATSSFGEPEVNVVTTANFSFLDVTTSTDGTSKDFQMLPIQPSNQNLVGARVLIGERENLVKAIRSHNRLDATYEDTAGEVKSIRFSLRGSNDAIRAAFKRCELEFLDDLVLPDPL